MFSHVEILDYGVVFEFFIHSSNTRKKILDSGKGYMGDLKSKFDDLSKEVTNKYDNFVSDTKKAVENQTK